MKFKSVLCYFLLLGILTGCEALSGESNIEPDSELSSESNIELDSELSGESDVEQLEAPFNVTGSYDSVTGDITLKWEYEFSSELDETTKGEFFFEVCADTIYGDTHSFAILPKEHREVIINIDDFLDNNLTRNIYIYAQYGIDDIQNRSEKSEPFQYKESDPEKMSIQPY